MKRACTISVTIALTLLATVAIADQSGQAQKSAPGHKSSHEHKAAHGHCDAELEVCFTKMAEKLKAKGWVGVELNRQQDGTLIITRVVPDSPAAAAGLKKSDRIVALNGVPYATQDTAALERAYKTMVPAKTITYTVDRQGRQLDLDIRLAHLPERIRAQWIAKHLLEAHSQPAN